MFSENKMVMNRRGISAVVATVLIILITIAAIVIIWAAIVPIIQEQIEGIDKVRVDMIIVTDGYTVWDEDTRVVQVQVKRGTDEVDVSGVMFYFSDDKGVSHSASRTPAPGMNEMKSWFFDCRNFEGDPTGVSIAAIFEDGSVSEILSTVSPIPTGSLSGVTVDLTEEHPSDGSGNSYPGNGNVVVVGGCFDNGDCLPIYSDNVCHFDPIEGWDIWDENIGRECSGGSCVDSGSITYDAIKEYCDDITGCSEDTDVCNIPMTYDIGSCGELQNMKFDLGGSYVLVGDVTDCVGFSFVPVGDDVDPFTGDFDGNGNVISNLAISKPGSDYVGLFGVLGVSSSVYDVGLSGVVIDGDQYVGGLAGENSGTVSRSYVTGDVSASLNAGGLVGRNNDIGVVPIVEDSYAVVDVDVDTGTYAGGLVGENDGIVRNSYAVGVVTCSGQSGGLIGASWGESTIENSFSSVTFSGSCTVNTDNGGVAQVIDGAYTNLYWNNINPDEPETCYVLEAGDPECIAIANDVTYFYDSANEPMVSWEAPPWRFSPTASDFPKLDWE